MIPIEMGCGSSSPDRVCWVAVPLHASVSVACCACAVATKLHASNKSVPSLYIPRPSLASGPYILLCHNVASPRPGLFTVREELPDQQRIRCFGGRGVLCAPTAHQTNGGNGVSPESE